MSGGVPIVFLVIHEDGRIEWFDSEVTDKLVRDVVGGDFETIQPTDWEVTLFVNTDGKKKGLNPNWLATSLARTRMRPADFIVGPCLVTGLPDEDGDVQPLSEATITLIQERGTK